MALTNSKAVVIIGGGFTGAAIAYHLDRLAPGAASIVVVEPRSSLGGGLAYSTADPAHRINVPASRMSLDPDEPMQFDAWLDFTSALRDDPQARLPDGRAFPRRSAFGRYVQEKLSPALEAGRVIHKRAKVLAIDSQTNGYAVELSTGETIHCDIAVIATTHPAPTPPAPLSQALADDPRFIPDANAPDALDGVRTYDRVLVVGAGLTMADIVASLDRRGHRGSITALSRRGQLPAQHPPAASPDFGDFVTAPATTTRHLVRAVRAAVVEAEAQGLPWQCVFDALRNQGRGIWAALEPGERRKLALRLRPFWDARRFRIAPQVQDVLEKRRREGTFESLAGSIRQVKPKPAAIAVDIRLRGLGQAVSRDVDAVVVATGPAHRDVLCSQPYLNRLEADGLVSLDAVGLGLATDMRGRAIGKAGQAIDTLLIGGPLARGTFGELMGLPEVTRHAVDIAREIAASIKSDDRTAPKRLLALTA